MNFMPRTIRVPRVRTLGRGIVAATILALAISLPAQAPADAAIRAMMVKSVDDWNRHDLDAFATCYKNSPDILFVGTQVSRGFDHMLADYKKNYATKDAMGALSYLDLEPHVLDEHFAVVVGRYHLERAKKFGGTSEGLFSLVLEKTPEGWKIIVDHTT